MLSMLSLNWWSLVLRGVVAILFGLLALVWPGIGLTVLIALFGAYALVDGIFAIVAALSRAGRLMNAWPLLLEGVLGVIVGVLTFVWPRETALVLLYIIAAWAILTGGAEIVQAVRLRQEIRGEWLLILSGALSVLFGLLLFIQPGAGALAVIFIIAFYAIFFGTLLISLGLRLRHLQQELSPGGTSTAAQARSGTTRR